MKARSKTNALSLETMKTPMRQKFNILQCTRNRRPRARAGLDDLHDQVAEAETQADDGVVESAVSALGLGAAAAGGDGWRGGGA